VRYVTTIVLLTAIACGTEQEPEKERVYVTRVSPSPVPGNDGNSCSVSDTGLITCTDGTSYQVSNGADGETIVGPSGEPGPAGDSIVGPQGPAGDAGIAGTSCSVNNSGLVSCTDGSSYQIPDPVDGAVGPMGPVGPVGPAGPAGTSGPPGSDGSNGDDGTTWAFTYQTNSPCTQVSGTTKWVNNSTIYSSNACDNSVKLGTIGEGSWFWLTTSIVLVRIDGIIYRGQSN
jgi:hypothetical protein